MSTIGDRNSTQLNAPIVRTIVIFENVSISWRLLVSGSLNAQQQRNCQKSDPDKKSIGVTGRYNHDCLHYFTQQVHPTSFKHIIVLMSTSVVRRHLGEGITLVRRGHQLDAYRYLPLKGWIALTTDHRGSFASTPDLRCPKLCNQTIRKQ